jgi:hypothetical protein
MVRFLLLGCSLLGACTTAPVQGSDAVEVVSSPGAVSGCQFLRNVRGDQNLYGGAILAKAAYEDAIQQMRNATAQAGGNRLFVAFGSTGILGANVVGDAYRC